MQQGQFASKRYQSGQWFAIADVLQTTGESVVKKNPVIADNDGEARSIVFDDTSSLIAYHTVNSLEYEIASSNYGQPGNTMKETASMKLVMFGSRTKLQTRVENLVAAAVLDIPKEFSSSTAKSLQIASCIIEIGTVNTDVYSIWAREFVGTPFSLEGDTVAFELLYKIINIFNKRCFNLCQNTVRTKIC
jgi:hypothetical protein